ncbi:MAG: uncharacterized protein KVP18_001912 [Porospora cf. gigantea A]|nr:MAG: hypothetical protein KVP18_001912 [Porospora cf. gigantea A]
MKPVAVQNLLIARIIEVQGSSLVSDADVDLHDGRIVKRDWARIRLPWSSFILARRSNVCFITIEDESTRESCMQAWHGAHCKTHTIDVCISKNPPKKRNADEQHREAKKLKGVREEGLPLLLELIESNKRKGIDLGDLKSKVAPLHEWAYRDQLQMKHQYGRTVMKQLTRATARRCGDDAPAWVKDSRSLHGVEVQPIIASPETHRDHYRNKCEFTIAYANEESEEGVNVGFVRCVRNNVPTVEAPDAPHIPDCMQKLCERVKAMIAGSRLAVYSRSKQQGCWRCVLVRVSESTKQMMLAFLTGAGFSGEVHNAVRGLYGEFLGEYVVASVFHVERAHTSDSFQGDEEMKLVVGAQTITMGLRELRFLCHPKSFFQTNIGACELLYDKVVEWLDVQSNVLVLDLCSGTGTISCYVAKHLSNGSLVLGVEMVPEAVTDARVNAELNKLSCRFLTGKVEDVVPSLLAKLETGGELDGVVVPKAADFSDVVAIVDPPRAGLQKSVVQCIRSCQMIKRLVYVSCNPDTLRENAIELTNPVANDGYTPKKCVVVDMFPHTFHCEMVTLFSR